MNPIMSRQKESHVQDLVYSPQSTEYLNNERKHEKSWDVQQFIIDQFVSSLRDHFVFLKERPKKMRATPQTESQTKSWEPNTLPKVHLLLRIRVWEESPSDGDTWSSVSVVCCLPRVCCLCRRLTKEAFWPSIVRPKDDEWKISQFWKTSMGKEQPHG